MVPVPPMGTVRCDACSRFLRPIFPSRLQGSFNGLVDFFRARIPGPHEVRGGGIERRSHSVQA